ncbi:MAG: hypothetical protein A2637_07965 [Candidatus Muproteobacteria bacterium RIFCSPHIGHO2_01_FULL_65_16]|uniref:Ribbon-helix-helix protein CopG domain-containing protein n=1 Tax=Candidatus Muproteobacteria bacterium RIFCSPHIGHO2_01_FULL_65_16 TaxID=1817764 RepID=A0A1F6TLM6_9PROT|nr:MAG: hypothetical protein A2637_07965 [Candidatus Muproteobacteria bacterium RIFCSPHIGHO2_01_FULL_65_16]
MSALLERTVVLLRREQRRKLDSLAKAMRLSAAEIHRRAIDAYEPAGQDQKDLEHLADEVIRTNKRALQALARAEKEVEETLRHFGRKHGGARGHQRKDI